MPIMKLPENFKFCPLCGPKMSAFCMLIFSVGIVFLGLLGSFFYFKCNTLFNELNISNSEVLSDKNAPDFSREAFVQLVHSRYQSCAYNCWIAAALYLVTLVGTVWQNRWNTQSAFE